MREGGKEKEGELVEENTETYNQNNFLNISISALFISSFYQKGHLGDLIHQLKKQKRLTKEHTCIARRHRQQCADSQGDGLGAGRKQVKGGGVEISVVVSTIKIKEKKKKQKSNLLFRGKQCAFLCTSLSFLSIFSLSLKMEIVCKPYYKCV